MGIEPTSEAWEASILPLYDARVFLLLAKYTRLILREYRVVSTKKASAGSHADRASQRALMRSSAANPFEPSNSLPGTLRFRIILNCLASVLAIELLLSLLELRPTAC
jgi:hypothetical protein